MRSQLFAASWFGIGATLTAIIFGFGYDPITWVAISLPAACGAGTFGWKRGYRILKEPEVTRREACVLDGDGRNHKDRPLCAESWAEQTA